MTALSWTAKRHGEIFCAPACGFKCKWSAYQRAKRDGAALARRLGKTWKPRVWENMGWHYNAIDKTGYWKVHPNISSYTAFFGTSESGGRWAEHDKTPEEAIANVRRKFISEMENMHLLQLAVLTIEVRRGL